MKLNKNICKKCMDETETIQLGLGLEITYSKPVPWFDVADEAMSPSDKDRWHVGLVLCPNSDYPVSINEIPSHCKYALEHMVMKQ